MSSRQTSLTTKTTLIRASKFNLCHQQSCSILSGPHLLIATTLISLSKENAIAISYAWGEFARAPRAIGHKADGTVVFLELGQEWHVNHLIQKLAYLCESQFPGYCWLDQLSVPQRGEEIRQILASIPAIFKCLHVFVVFPVANCRCFNEKFGFVSNFIESSRLQIVSAPRFDRQLQAATGHSTESGRLLFSSQSCLHFGGFCSWFKRLWTRQELMYASRIQLIRASREFAPCIRTGGLVSLNHVDLEPFVQLTMQEALEEAGYTPHDVKSFIQARMQVKMELAKLVYLAQHSFADFVFTGVTQLENVPPTYTMSAFLLGYPIQIHRSNDDQHPQLFVARIANLARSPRMATDVRDYINAIWVDCPRYELPRDYRTAGLGDLLDDAAKQLETNFNQSVPTLAVASLFDDPRGCSGGLWRPSKLLEEDHRPRDATLVYGSVRSTILVPVTDTKRVPFQMFPARLKTRPLSWWASDYTSWISELPLPAIIRCIRQIASNWSIEPLGFSTLVEVGTAIRTPEQKLRLHLANIDIDDNYTPQNVTANELYVNLHHLVSKAMGIEPDISRRAKLRLAVVPRTIPTNPAVGPCIGLTKTNLGLSRTYWDEGLFHGSVKTIWFPSISIRIPATRIPQIGGQGYWLELMKINKKNTAQSNSRVDGWEVIGAWVQTQYAPLGCLGAIVAKGETRERVDGYII